MNEREERYADDQAANRAMLDEVSRAFRGQGYEPTFQSEGERLRYWKAKSALLRYLYDGKAEDVVGAESKVAELTRVVEDRKEIVAETIRQVTPQLKAADDPIEASIGPDNGLKGVTLFDAAYFLQQDDLAATDLVKKWDGSRKFKAESVGKCPRDGHRPLYRFSDVVGFVLKTSAMSGREESQLREALKDKLRSPRSD